MSRRGADPEVRERRRRLGRGRRGEGLARLLLMAKGYRILASRLAGPYGEIDIIAARRDRIAFIEVKRRRTLAEAEAALTPAQAQRIARAADHWLSRHEGYLGRDVGLDAILVVPFRLPRHIHNALDEA